VLRRDNVWKLGLLHTGSNSVRCLEIRTKMTLLSAHDDFVLRTLGALQGCWARLVYTAQLRDENGRYLHWGLDRVYGTEKAQATMQQAHREVFRQVLRKKMEDLAREEGGASPVAAVTAESCLMPPGTSRAAQLHFSAVFFALARLRNAKNRVA